MVSVIIPNYNHAPYLKQRIDSVFNQTYQDFELILLDDCSTDGSSQILQEYENHPKVSALKFNKENSGSPFKQWSKGIEIAKGEYIWIAESDDTCGTLFLERLISKICENKNIVLAYGKSIKIYESGEIIEDYKYKDFIDGDRWNHEFFNDGVKEIKSYLYKRNTIPNASAVIFRRDIAQRVINYISDYKMIGDWKFYIHLLEKGTIIYDPNAINYFRYTKQASRNHNTPGKIYNRYTEQLKLNKYLNRRSYISKKDLNSINKNCIYRITQLDYNIDIISLLGIIPVYLFFYYLFHRFHYKSVLLLNPLLKNN